MQRLGIIVIGLCLWASSAWTTPADTLKAQVMYGSHMLLSDIEYKSGPALALYLDSLSSDPTVPESYRAQVALLSQIKNRSFSDLYAVIDSLFELDEVPYALINEVNLLISQDQNLADSHETLRRITHSQHPADNIYSSWNITTTQPYTTKDLSLEDTAFYLDLLPANSQFVMPVNNVLTSKFGWRDGKPHNGIDIDLEVWDTVVAAFDGEVRLARTCGGYGRTVIIRHDNGLETTYAHLHRLKVKSGQRVKAGSLIGLGGSSGHSTGSHLHWEIRYKGRALNPLNFINYETGQLTNAVLYVKQTKHGFAAFPYGSEFYTVQRGDYLYKIAHEHGISIDRICALNGIHRNTKLAVGQQLRII